MIEKNTTYHLLMLDAIDHYCRGEQVRDLSEYGLFSLEVWEPDEVVLSGVEERKGQWVAQLLLKDRNAPFTFIKQATRKCRTPKIAEIVGRYTGRMIEDARQGEAVSVAETDRFCWN